MKESSMKKPGRGMQQAVPRKSLYHRGRIEGNQYVFGNDDNSEDEENHPMKEYKQEPFLEKELQPGDTLQTLSLQFNCPIAELKRINNIHRDNEIFARRTIKVPMKVFTNKLVDVHTTSFNKTVERNEPSTSSTACPDTISKKTSPTRHIPIQISPSEGLSSAIPEISSGKQSRTFLEDGVSENLDEDCSTNPLLAQEQTSKDEGKNSMYSCNGADWGISWFQLLICTLFLGCAGPILYVILITENSNKKP
ncbi:hypothetical protein C0J52_07768 [Blattella germanica]|nr:hypothetical protein C0J52_07768 [Blattella germanica]